jgi:hypothetical protein
VPGTAPGRHSAGDDTNTGRPDGHDRPAPPRPDDNANRGHDGRPVAQAVAAAGARLGCQSTVPLAVVLALGALMCVVAAVRPAHPAARLDVLAAIASE